MQKCCVWYSLLVKDISVLCPENYIENDNFALETHVYLFQSEVNDLYNKMENIKRIAILQL